MKQEIYSIRDNVAEVFNKPFFDHNNATAIRSFTASIQDQPHKDDYSLYLIGCFDDSNGDIQRYKEPTRILSGLDVKRPEENNLLADQAI